jgi:beta-glucanase (GH16 family)
MRETRFLGRLGRAFGVGAVLAFALPHCVLALPPPLTEAPDGRALVLTLDRTFSRPDSAPDVDHSWRTTYRDGSTDGIDVRTLAGNGEQEIYVDPAYGAEIGVPGLEPFSVSHGTLEITAKPASPDLAEAIAGRRFTSGLMTTQPSFSQLYGYFEVRAKLPKGKGLWPTVWMLPADMTWPPELDIMESLGDPKTVYFTAHTQGVAPHPVQATLRDDGFHTFAVSWDSQQVVWYVDGHEVARQKTPPDMHKPMFLLANLAVGGNWPGPPDESTPFPAKFSIAYIRAYRFSN